jgi:hypothetical protein
MLPNLLPRPWVWSQACLWQLPYLEPSHRQPPTRVGEHALWECTGLWWLWWLWWLFWQIQFVEIQTLLRRANFGCTCDVVTECFSLRTNWQPISHACDRYQECIHFPQLHTMKRWWIIDSDMESDAKVHYLSPFQNPIPWESNALSVRRSSNIHAPTTMSLATVNP